MMRRRSIRLAGLCLALSLPAAALGQGLYWESTATGSIFGEKGLVTKNFGMPKMYKNEGESMIMIFRLDKELIYRINPKEKTYTEMTFAEMEARIKETGAKMDAAMEEIQKKLKGLPEEKRKRLEKMMEGKMPARGKEGKVEVAATGEKKTLLGYSCDRYVARQDGKEVLTAWVTKEIKDFELMRKDWQEIQRRMTSMAPMMSKGISEAFTKLDGLPLEMEVSGMKTVVTKVEGRPIAPAEFEVPEGYRKVEVKPPLPAAMPGKTS